MLRTDTTALFERLREANILLQEVLTGAHENMSSLENALVDARLRIRRTMNDVDRAQRRRQPTRWSEHIDAFHSVTRRCSATFPSRHPFETHGRALVQAVELIDKSNRRTEDAVAERRDRSIRWSPRSTVKTEDLEQRLQRFTALLDESLESATPAHAISAA